MRFNICTNLDNGVGLEADYKLLKGLLEDWGHIVNGVHYQRLDGGTPVADVNIFLEVIAPVIMPKAKQNWFIPNPEWYCHSYDAMMPGMTKILCKTHDANRIFINKAVRPERVIHIGFESRDLFDPSVPRKRKFLHVAGKSAYKNSEAVAYAFAKFFDQPWEPESNRELVFIGSNINLMHAARDHKNVTYVDRATPEEFRRLMNECQFHIIPSQAEGWGHAIHEGLGCGAFLITTDFPPMNEFSGAAMFLPANKLEDCCASKRAWVSALEVKDAVEKAWKMPEDVIFNVSMKSRRYFADQRDYFRNKFRWVVDNANNG